jgi:hypothetical protein
MIIARCFFFRVNLFVFCFFGYSLHGQSIPICIDSFTNLKPKIIKQNDIDAMNLKIGEEIVKFFKREGEFEDNPKIDDTLYFKEYQFEDLIIGMYYLNCHAEVNIENSEDYTIKIMLYKAKWKEINTKSSPICNFIMSLKYKDWIDHLSRVREGINLNICRDINTDMSSFQKEISISNKVINEERGQMRRKEDKFLKEQINWEQVLELFMSFKPIKAKEEYLEELKYIEDFMEVILLDIRESPFLEEEEKKKFIDAFIYIKTNNNRLDRFILFEKLKDPLFENESDIKNKIQQAIKEAQELIEIDDFQKYYSIKEQTQIKEQIKVDVKKISKKGKL